MVTKELQLQSSRATQLWVQLSCRENLGQGSHNIKIYTPGSQKQFGINSEFTKCGALTENQAHLAMNILLLLHHECVTTVYLGFILDARLGRQARNHPRVPRQALVRGTPDGAELLDWGRSAPGKQGGGAGCIQMHGVGTCTILEGNGAGIQTSLNSPLHNAVETACKHCS